MAKTLWNINFSTLNVTNERAAGKASKYTHTDNLTNGIYTADGQGSTPSFALNAIDIDWNGAILDSKVISTTGDLLKYIKAKSDLTIGNTSYTAAAGDHTHELTLQENAYATSSIDLLDDTIYTLNAGGKSLTFKTPSGGATYTAGTNITIDSNTISHATPENATEGKKGNIPDTLLATITTDSQGHVTGYEEISPAELWSLLQPYADDLYQPKPVEVTDIFLDHMSLSVPMGRDVMITATISPSNATNKKITWASSDTSIATVTSPTTSGNAAIVTWQGAGKATITATAEGDTSKTAQCEVTCESLQPTTTYYYSVGTEEVTVLNYTSANNAQSVTNVNDIPNSLDISTLVGPVYILLPSGKTPTIVPNSGAGRVALTSLTSPVSGYSYWKSARFAAGATMTIS